MPVLPDTPITAQVNMNFVLNGETVVNVFHVRNQDIMTPPDLATIGGVFGSWWTDTWRDRFSSDIELQNIKLIDLTSPTSAQLLYTTSLPSSGGVGADSIPNNAAALMVHGVGVRRRGVNGRSFFSGIPENATDGQILATGVAAGMQADFAALITALASAGYDLGIVSYYEDKVLRETGLFRYAVTNNMSNQLASQRLRLHGRKRKKRT